MATGVTQFLRDIFISCRLRLIFFILKNGAYVKSLLGIHTVKHNVYEYYEYNGVPLSAKHHPIERVKLISKYEAFRPDDVVLLTYPKSGTHFCGDIIASIYKEVGKLSKDVRMKTMTPMEIDPFKISTKDNPLAGLEIDSPRILGSHLRWSLLPQKIQEAKVKVICCFRDPKDIVCSFYPFHKKLAIIHPHTTFGTFFNNFIRGKGVYGCYCEYMQQLHRLAKWDSPNMLLLTFEEMKEHTSAAVIKISTFLGIKLTAEQVSRVAAENQFSGRKKELNLINHAILRSGKVGGWKSQFTVEQNGIFDQYLRNGLKGIEDFPIKYE